MLFEVVRYSPRFLLILFLAAFSVAPLALAQELTTQPTPFTALLDFATLRNPAAPKTLLPIWLESVQVVSAEMGDAATVNPSGLPEEKQPPHTVWRIRLRQMPGLNDQVMLRLFFEDKPEAHPTVTAWSEIGERLFASEPLGAGLELAASETLSIPTKGVNYIEIDVPGDGSNLRKALLMTLKKTTVSTALDFTQPATSSTADPIADPFGNATSQALPENDSYLFGRVRATLASDIIKLTPPTARDASIAAVTGSATQSSVSFEFNLESAPLLAFVALDILGADPIAPLQAWVNDKTLGPLVAQLPDLADPAYTGVVRPLLPMRFRYAGWLHGQLIIPGSALQPGNNILTLQLPADAGPAAIRSIELQLKHNWRILDYNLAP